MLPAENADGELECTDGKQSAPLAGGRQQQYRGVDRESLDCCKSRPLFNMPDWPASSQRRPTARAGAQQSKARRVAQAWHELHKRKGTNSIA